MKGKPWVCKNGHVLGMVHRGRRGIRYLRLWRIADQPGDVIGVLNTGSMRDVRCSICGELRSWHADDEALRELMEQIAPLKSVEN